MKNNDKWKSLLKMVAVTVVLLIVLFVATSHLKITNAGKSMISILVIGSVLVIYTASRLMNTYFHPTLKKYITFFCWTVFILAATIIYSFIGLIAEVNTRNQPLNTFLMTRVFYNNPEKLEFTKKFEEFIRSDGSDKEVLDTFNSLISLDSEWLNRVLMDKRPVFQKKNIQPSSNLFGSGKFLKQVRTYVKKLLLIIRSENNFEKKLSACKKLLVFAQMITRAGIYGHYSTLIESMVGFAIEKRALLTLMDFIQGEPDFWTRERKDETLAFIQQLKRVRLTASEAYDGEYQFCKDMLHYLYVKHTYAMFWLDLYFGSASLQHTRIMGFYLEALRKEKTVKPEVWRRLNAEAKNPLIAISNPNLRSVYTKFKEFELYFDSAQSLLSEKTMKDPYVPGKSILQKKEKGKIVFYSRGANKIDEGALGDDVVAR